QIPASNPRQNQNTRPASGVLCECMKASLWATLIATLFGTGAWLSGLSQMLWPDHPMIATLVLTVVTYALVHFLWPQPRPR
ncbi:MAG TPA: hypothetical protein VN648_13205, partial [Candidatus Methylomirabilis sp.]|nr:hypothetical protein [Candidatus Methylomirabilis sp.]